MAIDRVTLRFSLAMSEPSSISISKPETAESLKLVATIKQESSPFPDRPVTLLITNSILDNGRWDAFYQQLLGPPTDVNDDKNRILMHQFNVRCRPLPHRIRDYLPTDLRRRGHYNFTTVPPPGQGSVDITWAFAPKKLFRIYIDMGRSTVEEQLKKYTVGQKFQIRASWYRRAIWWTWGSPQHDLKDKKFSHWSLPTDLPLNREAGQDENDKTNQGLIDCTENGLKPTNTPDTEAEEPPKVKEMRAEGWVFGEPPHALELICDQYATFCFVE